ncbi:potassium channel family protein [Roseovarius sp. SCSIO 43702]|uniref:potassium channel family protein n=1 Tax=Roseovarius sp. SCSIO 43702 TaxID=2823043 RepID=UPI001C7354A0|nr:potassium channel family protein [Roseovarius sp. SCSIO 43702]QYX55345.1 potassium channel family protein [Roseovarius sp. SCSIO 43702]
MAERKRLRFRAASILGLLVTIIASGTIFFRWTEGWSWLDSYFFTVVTLSTVGYGNLVPATSMGKIGTTVLIFVGLGIFALAIQNFAEFTVHRRARRRLRTEAQDTGDEPGRTP